MKRLMLLLMVCAVGLCGYQLGRLPGGPDAVGWLRQQADSIDLSDVAEAAGQLADSGRREAASWLSEVRDDPPSPAGPPAAARPDPPRLDRPRCW